MYTLWMIQRFEGEVLALVLMLGCELLNAPATAQGETVHHLCAGTLSAQQINN